ncbi:NAD(P)-dependent alcohol dehydrogenase [Nocardioides sp. GCM10028917]|uniref:NAD(P)-dependent alcohol dehydrogenase n=1 Tax=Nocardioides sp. GCM10028917 TaxID=3273408 RepID=UPI0036090DC0
MGTGRIEDGAAPSPLSARSDPTGGRAVTQTRYGGPEVLRLTRRPRPHPGEGQVLVNVQAASVNARDWHVMRGEPRVARLMDRTLFAARRPRIATRGTDLAGVVESVGDGVTTWKPGDTVFGEGIGAFADYAVASADQLAVMPAGTSFQEAAALPLAATTALLCLDETSLEPGGSILINGASGGVGTFAVQAAKARGLHVTAVVSTRNIGLVRSLGTDAVIDYTATDFTRTGRTYDAVVDLVGNRRLRDLRRSVRSGGTLVLSGGGIPGNGRLVGPLRLLIGATAVARFQPFEVKVPQAVPNSPTLARVADLVGSGSLRPLIDRTFPLMDAAAAVRYVETEHPRGKVVLTIG